MQSVPLGPPIHVLLSLQDPKEMFDLYEPPTPEERAGAKVTQLRPSGLRKARAKVHAEGDWHR